MKKTVWWLRVVGGFYLLLTLMNLYGLFLSDGQLFRDILPYASEGTVVRAFMDAWMVFIFELAALAVAMLYAARQPEQSRMLMLAVIAAEILRGVVADAIWITRGYSAASYIPFIVIHLVIIVTGIMALPKKVEKAGEP
ncbi:MAG: BphX family protein [Chlorobi bacterium]|jgi:hypothetical protein|nr:BphX family protein [Chlorobiota bacterium]